jgi:serine/threonine protein kinase
MNSPPSSNPWLGRYIGDNQRYRLDKRLGKGGMGEVFLAMDTRVGQQVALKLLKDTLVASPEMRKRFEREVAVCAALQSDHIVKIMDCGVSPEGYPFYVMEYLRGQTLRQLMLSEKRLSVERTVNIITQVCQGLQLAHKGVILHRDGGKSTEHIKVIHRDLKPDNIFLLPTDLGEWIKILDFGVVKIRSESYEQTNITSTFIGTFRYAAPEQIKGDNNLDARADIYSLGIILYEMLSGADPFGFSTKGHQISEASWVLAHTHELPRALRSQPGCERLSQQLEAVVMKCLQKRADDRFASVEELNQAMHAAAKSISINPGRNSETIFQPKPLQRQGYQEETVPRVPNPVEQANSAPINHPQHPLPKPGSYEETAPRVLNRVEQPNSPPANIPQTPSPKPGSHEETVPRVLNRVEQPNSPPANIPQTPSPNPSSNLPPQAASNEPGQQTPKVTIVQQRPGTPSGAQSPGGTIVQPRRSESSGEQPPPGTIIQPRRSESSGEQPPPGTIIQPRRSESSGEQPPPGTIIQPRRSESSGEQPPPGTIVQPRRSESSSKQPPVTIVQPRRSESSSKQPPVTIVQPRSSKPSDGQTLNKLPMNALRILGLLIAVGLVLGVGIYVYNQSKPPQGTQENRL